ncbi:hypothetical protein ACLB2K_071123 [Fragaria x ananassa]
MADLTHLNVCVHPLYFRGVTTNQAPTAALRFKLWKLLVFATLSGSLLKFPLSAISLPSLVVQTDRSSYEDLAHDPRCMLRNNVEASLSCFRLLFFLLLSQMHRKPESKSDCQGLDFEAPSLLKEESLLKCEIGGTWIRH